MPKHIYPVRPAPEDAVLEARKRYDASVLGRGLCEMRLVWNLLHDLEARGLKVTAVDDGGDDVVPTPTLREAFDAVFSVDDAHLIVNGTADGDATGTIRIVLGNDGYDAVCDWRADPDGALWKFLDDWTEDTERFL